MFDSLARTSGESDKEKNDGRIFLSAFSFLFLIPAILRFLNMILYIPIFKDNCWLGSFLEKLFLAGIEPVKSEWEAGPSTN